MLATLTPQEAIKKGLPTPAQCDIVIVIFWPRMGIPLPADWKKPDGSRYLSGTEWEYCNALEAAEQHGEPKILLYRRTTTSTPSIHLSKHSSQPIHRHRQGGFTKLYGLPALLPEDRWIFFGFSKITI